MKYVGSRLMFLTVVSVGRGGCFFLDLVVLEGGLDGVLSQHGAVELHRGQTQLLSIITSLHMKRK